MSDERKYYCNSHWRGQLSWSRNLGESRRVRMRRFLWFCFYHAYALVVAWRGRKTRSQHTGRRLGFRCIRRWWLDNWMTIRINARLRA